MIRGVTDSSETFLHLFDSGVCANLHAPLVFHQIHATSHYYMCQNSLPTKAWRDEKQSPCVVCLCWDLNLRLQFITKPHILGVKKQKIWLLLYQKIMTIICWCLLVFRIWILIFLVIYVFSSTFASNLSTSTFYYAPFDIRVIRAMFPIWSVEHLKLT